MTTNDDDELKQRVRDAVEDDNGDNVREEVRRITLKALSEGRLDSERLKRVMRTVTQGVGSARPKTSTAERKKFAEALRGIDEALAAGAEATQLAIREAAGRGSEFSRDELKRAMDGLSGLERSFIDTVSETARDTSDFVGDVFNDFARHARSSGTQVGAHVQASLTQLSEVISSMASAQLEAGAKGLREGGALLAGMAAGFFSGVAERLQGDGKQKGGKGSDGS